MKKIALLIALSISSSFAASAQFKWVPNAKDTGAIYSGIKTYKDLSPGESATVDLNKDLFCNSGNKVLIRENRLLRGSDITVTKDSYSSFNIKFNSTRYTNEEMLGMLGIAGAGKKCSRTSDYDGYLKTINGKTSIKELTQ